MSGDFVSRLIIHALDETGQLWVCGVFSSNELSFAFGLLIASVLLSLVGISLQYLIRSFNLGVATRLLSVVMLVMATAVGSIGLGTVGSMVANAMGNNAFVGSYGFDPTSIFAIEDEAWRFGGWGDSSGGRDDYSISEVNSGVLGNAITFNSISDSPIGNEKNFVGARADDGVKPSVWCADEIEAIEGKTYYVRLYVHNNSPLGLEAVAQGVTVNFHTVDSEKHENAIELKGELNCENAEPKQYWDCVRFVSDRPFTLKYLPGSARFNNNVFDSKCLGDEIVSDGVELGYEALNGRIPGCYQYAGVVTIRVTPVFDCAVIGSGLFELTLEELIMVIGIILVVFVLVLAELYLYKRKRMIDGKAETGASKRL